MYPLVILAAVYAPDLGRLGSDDWRTREAEYRRCDNLLSALMLPAAHPDPEVAARIRVLRTNNLKPLDPVYVERLIYRDDWRRWVGLYLVTGRTRLDPLDVFVDIHSDFAKARYVFDLWPVMPDENESFMYGAFFPGEYARGCDHCDYHLARAPYPREARTPYP